MIDPKEYLEIPYTELRSIVEPSFPENSIIKHKDYLPGARIIISFAVQINAKRGCYCSWISKYSYDFLVIATCRIHFGGRSKNDTFNHFHAEDQNIESSIYIIGGGSTSVELTTEISTEDS